MSEPEAKSLSKAQLEVVKATTPVVGANAGKITACFYATLLGTGAAKGFFNESHQQRGAQQKALADAVIAYASNIESLAALGPLVQKIAHRHVALSVTPDLYPVVHEHLMAAIGQVLGSAVTQEVAGAWSQAVLDLARVCIETEKELYAEYEQRAGGWRGERAFVLDQREVVAEGTVAFTFRPADGYTGGFAYSPGQYLTIRIPALGAAPRHYTVTSKPGALVLQCTTRKVDAGLVSTYMHDELKLGQEVLLGVPCGLFTARENQHGHVLVGAGIGVTPLLSLAAELGDKVKAVWTLQRSEDRVVSLGVAPAVLTSVFSEGGRPDLGKEAKKLVSVAGRAATYYLCGPPDFMAGFAHALAACGVAADDVVMELFGTGSVPECPVKKDL